MPWGSIRGHDRVVEGLRRSLAEGKLPHALLFVGPEGVGKKAFAIRMAEGLLCESRPEASLDPCGACPSCQQVPAGNHPDLIVVGRPEEKHELPIQVIRELCRDLGLKPMRGDRRVAIVDDADDLSEEAANAFLKTLEEPPPGAVLILLATSAESQLDTVVSRCRVVRFEPLSENELAAVLIERGLASNPAEAARLARSAEGSVGRAGGLADPDLERFRRALIDEVAGPRGFDPSALATRIDAFLKEAGKESADRRARAGLLIGELTRLFRGVLWQVAGLPAPSADPEDRKAAGALGARLGPEDVFGLVDRCLQADAQVRRKAYLPLILESLMVDLGRVLNAADRPA